MAASGSKSCPGRGTARRPDAGFCEDCGVEFAVVAKPSAAGGRTITRGRWWLLGSSAAVAVAAAMSIAVVTAGVREYNHHTGTRRGYGGIGGRGRHRPGLDAFEEHAGCGYAGPESIPGLGVPAGSGELQQAYRDDSRFRTVDGPGIGSLRSEVIERYRDSYEV